jgi:hypothetical protein
MGEEKLVTLQLLRKCIARANTGDVSLNFNWIINFLHFSHLESVQLFAKKASKDSSMLRRVKRQMFSGLSTEFQQLISFK